MAKENANSLPYLAESVWWKIREKFKKSLPAKVDSAYLASVLGGKESSAGVYLSKLKNLKLISDDGRPEKLANLWRDDVHYAEACTTILNGVSSKDLRDSFPPPNPDLAEVTRWLQLAGSLGEAAARNNANFYVMLAHGKLIETKPNATVGKANLPVGARASKSIKTTTKNIKPQGINPQSMDAIIDPPRGLAAATNMRVNPNIQLNIEIHINPQVSPEQIEAIFASMAKHLSRG